MFIIKFTDDSQSKTSAIIPGISRDYIFYLEEETNTVHPCPINQIKEIIKSDEYVYN